MIFLILIYAKYFVKNINTCPGTWPFLRSLQRFFPLTHSFHYPGLKTTPATLSYSIYIWGMGKEEEITMLKVHKIFKIVLRVNQTSVVLEDFAILSLQNSSLPLYIFQHTLWERVGIFLETLPVMSSRCRHWYNSSLLIIFIINRLCDSILIELLVIHRAFGYSNWSAGCWPCAYLSVNLCAWILCRTVKQSLQKKYTNYFSK